MSNRKPKIPGTVRMNYVKSSNLYKVGYAVKERELYIIFKKRKYIVYVYSNVMAPVYRALIAAESKGEFFQRKIRNRYRYREVSL